MTRRLLILISAIAASAWLVDSAPAHPASGIVVNAQGEVFFIYTHHAVMKIDKQGKLDIVHKITDGHWLALDAEGRFSHNQPKYFQRITPDGEKPALIYAGGGAPLVVGADGNLYYGSGSDDENPGGLSLTRETPAGRRTKFCPALTSSLRSIDDGITGLAAGHDGAIYVATWTAVFKVNKDGGMKAIASPVTVPGCDFDPADHKSTSKRPYLRGLAVDSEGAVIAAATSCHCVVKIAADGTVSTVLKVERPGRRRASRYRAKTCSCWNTRTPTVRRRKAGECEFGSSRATAK